jgi:hypothetical protein
MKICGWIRKLWLVFSGIFFIGIFVVFGELFNVFGAFLSFLKFLKLSKT